MWVPIIENGEHKSMGADYFIKEYIDSLFKQSADIDTVLLGCTHYPLLIDKIKNNLPVNVTVIDQGIIVARSLADYLHRHPEIDFLCSKKGIKTFYTTDNTEVFDQLGELFYGDLIKSEKAVL